ncbi:MAG: ceramidase domain-containing protein [Proteobacteria bacterium]|nr:ceramidase domain-containing protein [Pseudomonadota bacterium]MDA1325676.1 ceramidase domain-containing protein [Pseudomonadota bacterium]
MTYKTRVWIVVALTLAIGVGTLFINPLPQDPAYHLFADRRGCLGIPNFGNVVSNAAFTLVGLIGLAVLYGGKSLDQRRSLIDTLPFAVFFTGVALVSAGSAYYHWQPDNDSLFWDRLPMTVAFMSITAAVVADRMHRAVGQKIVLPVLLVLGVASLVYWSQSEAVGRGDLRFYFLVQFLPIALIPLICWLFPDARYTKRRYILGMILCYGVALLFDRFDGAFYDLTQETISGHTVKHLIAAVATMFVIPMWRAGNIGNQIQA